MLPGELDGHQQAAGKKKTWPEDDAGHAHGSGQRLRVFQSRRRPGHELRGKGHGDAHPHQRCASEDTEQDRKYPPGLSFAMGNEPTVNMGMKVTERKPLATTWFRISGRIKAIW